MADELVRLAQPTGSTAPRIHRSRDCRWVQPGWQGKRLYEVVQLQPDDVPVEQRCQWCWGEPPKAGRKRRVSGDV